MKLGIVVGHNARARGAVRVTDGISEYDWNGELAAMIQAHDPASVRVFRRQAGGGYSREIDRVYAETDQWGADMTMELHFNGSVNPKANGCLMLSSGTRGSMALATSLGAKCSAAIGNRNRGVKIVKRGERGGRSLWQGRAPAVLTEPYFGSNAAECLPAQISMDELAEAHFRAAVRFMTTQAAA